MFKSSLGGLFVALVSAGHALEHYEGETVVYSSCNGLKDGSYQLQLRSDLPTVSAKCSNGYAIIDYNTDNQWSDYFTSWYLYHYGIAGPTKGDTVNWENWFLPDAGNGNVHYLISKDCTACDETALENQDHGLQSTYYMNASAFFCFSFGRSRAGCDMTYDTYECRACINTGNQLKQYFTDDIPAAATKSKEIMYYGNCYLERIESDFTVDWAYSQCTSISSAGAFKPSLGIDGRNCICANLRDDTSSQTQQKNRNEVDRLEPKAPQAPQHPQDPQTQQQQQQQEKQVAPQSQQQAGEPRRLQSKEIGTKEDNIVYLYQKDFKYGTYRITEPGYYIVMEDILFDFNSPWAEGTTYKDYDLDDFSPNAEGAWWPKIEQNEKYPHTMGDGDFSQAYFAGFFAGITVETDDVTIDLNNKILSMSKEYFYSQPHWSHIDLASQPFRPGTGLGFFGATPVFSNNVVIKDGTFGLTSHHCVHGSHNKNIKIENVVCKDFVTHGIQLNGFDDLEINNVEIGPSISEAWLSADYMSMRTLLPRFRYLANRYPDTKVQFKGKTNQEEAQRHYTMRDLLDELMDQLDMAFKHVVYGVEYDESDPSWKGAKFAFVKSDGTPNGGAMYGLFLNYDASGIPGYYLNADKSSNAKISNVYIHDLDHITQEALYFGKNRVSVNPITVPLKFKHVLGATTYDEYESTMEDDDELEFGYVGTVVTDIIIAMLEIAGQDNDNWGLLGVTYLGKLYDLAVANTPVHVKELAPQCAGDEFIHTVKGTFGLRVNGVENAVFENIRIENVLESGELGSDKCGNYQISHFTQQTPYSIGYTGNRAQGAVFAWADVALKNFKVNNVRSQTGASFGMALWAGADVTIHSDVTVKEVVGGITVDVGSLGTDDEDLPNYAPEACGIRVYSDLYKKNKFHDNDESATVKLASKDSNFEVSCIAGHVGCLLDEDGNFETNFDTSKLSKNAFTSHTSQCSNDYHRMTDDFTKIQVTKELQGANNHNNNNHHRSSSNSTIFVSILVVAVVGAILAFVGVTRKYQNKAVPSLGASEISPLIVTN